MTKLLFSVQRIPMNSAVNLLPEDNLFRCAVVSLSNVVAVGHVLRKPNRMMSYFSERIQTAQSNRMNLRGAIHTAQPINQQREGYVIG